MGIFEQFPYSNFHDLNLDWILNEIKEFQSSIEQTERDIDEMQHDITEFETSVQDQINEFSDQMESAVSEVLEELGVQPLPLVDGGDNGKVLTVVGGVWYKADVSAGNMPTLSADDYRKSVRVTESGDYRAEYLDEIVGGWESIESMPERIGFLQGTGGGWGTTAANPAYRHIIFPVKPGDKIKLISYHINSDKATYYAALKSYVGTGSVVVYSEDTAFDHRVSLPAPSSSNPVKFADLVMPSDAKYFYLAVKNNNAACIPSVVLFNGRDIRHGKTLGDVLSKNSRNIAERRVMQAFGADGALAGLVWEMGTYSTSDGIGKPLRPTQNTIRQRTAVPYISDSVLTVDCQSGYSYNVFLLDENQNYESQTNYMEGVYRIPANTYFLLTIRNAGNTDISNIDATEVCPVGIFGLVNDVYSLPVKWAAFGDSICEGVYSYMNGSARASSTNRVDTWAPSVAKKNNWDLTNYAVGGTGFIDPDNGGVGYDIIKTAASEAGFSDFNLVTIAYGINDWKDGNQTLGTINRGTLPATPTTVIEAMQISIEAILNANPNCKVIGILPINCAGYNFIIGDQEHKWGYGTKVPTGTGITLKEFCGALAEVYDYYGIQYIDLLNTSVVNRQNLPDILIDGVHPSLAGHKLLAHELSKRITF